MAGRRETVTGGDRREPPGGGRLTYEIWTALLFIDDKICPISRPRPVPYDIILYEYLAAAISHGRGAGRPAHMAPTIFIVLRDQ